MNSHIHAVLWRCFMAAAGCAVIAGCQATKTESETGANKTAASDGAADSVNVNFLLSMTWNEAKTINPQHLEIPPFYKVAADEVKVLRTGPTGQPLRVRARGRVFMEVDFKEKLIALGQEAYIESNGELIIRGKPLLKRGRSLVEGLEDTTVFYIQGTRLQVVGRHRLSKQQTAGESFPVAPTWPRSWKAGPNSLLPALSPDALPSELRANPFLPLPPEETGNADAPKKEQ
jgi:hypothetical protein